MERELLLLGLLREEGMHGYQINEFIQGSLASCTNLKKSTAYYLLDRMAQEGWVSSTTEREGNRPERRVYSITPAGEQTFLRLLRHNLASYQMPALASDIGLAFSDALPAGEVRALLEERRAQLSDRLVEARAVPAHPGRQQLVIDHQVFHLEAEIAWLDRVLAGLS